MKVVATKDDNDSQLEIILGLSAVGSCLASKYIVCSMLYCSMLYMLYMLYIMYCLTNKQEFFIRFKTKGTVRVVLDLIKHVVY